MHKVVSLFTGAGGLDLGLEAAGLHTAVAVEFDGPSCKTLRHNINRNRNWDVIERDVHEVPSDEILQRAGAGVGDVALLVGGPPCQPFSKSAFWTQGDTRRLADPRADTLTAYLRILRDIQPRAFLLENVFGLAYKGKDEGLVLLKDVVSAINAEVGTRYSFQWAVLNAANYGVPQIRERVFLVGSRDGRRFKFPEPTHYDPTAGLPETTLLDLAAGRLKLLQWSTAWDAIGDLNDLDPPDSTATGSWADLLPSIPEGSNYLHHTDRGAGLPLFGWRRRFWSFLLKLAKDRPSWTIQAQPGSAVGPFHWRNRRLSVLEMARIQTFPDGYTIPCGRTEAQRQIGNAVPSLMGEVLGRAIRAQLLDDPFGDLPLTLLPTPRLPCPGPEPLAPVPAKYLGHVGDHAAHPGTGKGHLVYGM